MRPTFTIKRHKFYLDKNVLKYALLRPYVKDKSYKNYGLGSVLLFNSSVAFFKKKQLHLVTQELRMVWGGVSGHWGQLGFSAEGEYTVEQMQQKETEAAAAAHLEQ